MADLFILTKYTLHLVENLAKQSVVIDNLRLLNNLLHPDKISTSSSRNLATSILFNNILHSDKIPTSPGERLTKNLINPFNIIQCVSFNRPRLEAFTAEAHFNPP